MSSRIKQLDGKILTAQDVAKILEVSSARVRQLEEEGKLPAAKTPKGFRIFCLSDVEKLAKERAKSSA